MSRLGLRTIAARSAIRAGLLPSLSPEEARIFLTEVLEAQQAPESLNARLVDRAVTPGPAVRLIEQMAFALGSEIVFQALAELLQKPVLVLVGPRGAGKSTLAAKLAARFGEREVMVITTRAAENGDLSQIEEFMSVLGVPLTIAADPENLRTLVAGAAGRRVIVDLANIAIEDAAGSSRLGALVAAAGTDPVLVLPADIEAADASACASAATKLGARHILATRLDQARRIGGLLAAADAGHLALVAASVTPHFAFGLQPLTPEMLARRLLIGAPEESRQAAG
jgi:flagellar biosynthesis protein FlhF